MHQRDSQIWWLEKNRSFSVSCITVLCRQGLPSLFALTSFRSRYWPCLWQNLTHLHNICIPACGKDQLDKMESHFLLRINRTCPHHFCSYSVSGHFIAKLHQSSGSPVNGVSRFVYSHKYIAIGIHWFSKENFVSKLQISKSNLTNIASSYIKLTDVSFSDKWT